MAPQDGRTSIFIDSHAHLADPAFTGDRDAVISRARDAGAQAIVCIGESLATAAIAAQYAADNPRFVFATAGIHPHDAAKFEASRDIPKLRELIRGSAVAVGECGLDYHYDTRSPARRVLCSDCARCRGRQACRRPYERCGRRHALDHS